MEKASRPFNNRNLFSNHYLENQIRASPEWARSDHQAAFEKIRRIYEREAAFVEGLSESQLEDRLFRSLFAVILPDYEVQGATKSQEFPDYAFFPDREARDRAQARKDTESFFSGAFAVGEVKRWDASLDRFGKDRQDKRRNPSFQIWLYLHETEPAWGILSNGAKWRLYRQERPLDVYYEVDLAAILEARDVEAFRYFYYFFRQEAFLPNQRGEVFLEEVLRGSANYAREIGENLKENVYRAMKKVAEGFIAWRENDLDPTDPETRGRVQKNTMILLYRFLFLLYAEGKELLDLRDEVYAGSYSFDRIKKEVAIRLDGPAAQGFLPIKRSLWSDLNDLFRLIDQGSRSLGIDGMIRVPAYNGGLFDPQKHPDLARWTIGDSYLAEAIDLLSRSEAGAGGAVDEEAGNKGSGKAKGAAGGAARGNGTGGANGGKGFVDYSTLEIRHLGSIYEGLLEYTLAVADGDLVVSGGKDRRWVPLAEFNQGKKKEKSFGEFGEFERAIAGDLYLTTDRGERKATGSYYTPDYIVDYIVEKTVGPVVEERWKEALLENSSLIEATLSVKVLDPAMGSGHFLVGAVEFLAGKLMRAADRDIEWGWVEDKGQFTPEWAKSEAVSHCVYGVDLNDLAVELAKVSLWLITIAKDKPLSFLDHRLKQGNSLVGARLSDLIRYPGEKASALAPDQVTLPSFVSPRFLQHLIGKIRELEEIGDDSLSEIKRKEEVFEEFRNLPEYTKAKAIANVHTAVYFGNEVEARATPQGTKAPDQVYHDLFWAVGGDEAEWRRKTSPAWFSEAQRIAGERSFFHWQLEFPEVFFEGGAARKNPGWDAVVGNPPYVDSEHMVQKSPEIREFISQHFKTARGNWDLYIPFWELALGLIDQRGNASLITPNKWLSAEYGQALRSFARDNLYHVADFSSLKVFEDASIFPVVAFMRKTLPTKLKVTIFSDQTKAVSEQNLPLNFLKDINNWGIMISKAPFMLQHIPEICLKLSDICIVHEAFTVSEAYELPALLKELEHEKEYLKFVVTGTVDRYTSLWGVQATTYLKEKYKMPIVNKTDFESRFIRRYKQAIEKKIIISGIRYFESFLDDSGSFLAGKSTTVVRGFDGSTYSAEYLLTILNSKFMTFYIKEIYGGLSMDGGINFRAPLVSNLPIRRISFSTPEAERRRLEEELSGLCAAGRFGEVLARVGDCLPKDDAGEFDAEGERSDIVHDLLAHLAEEMIRMNREKQEEIRGFLAWLEDFIGARVDDLSNKTRVQAYYEIEFSELLSVLKKNKRKLGVDPGRRAFGEDLRREFSASMEKLTPLLARIGETDRLIDAIVYRLYGLTEEEVAIVEGSLS